LLPLIDKETKTHIIMDDIFTLQTLASSELSGDTSLIIRIAMIVALLIKIEFKSLGRFYRMKLGIKD